MAVELRFAKVSNEYYIFLTNLLDFTKTIIPLTLMPSDSIVHLTFCFMGHWLIAHSGSGIIVEYYIYFHNQVYPSK